MADWQVALGTGLAAGIHSALKLTQESRAVGAELKVAKQLLKQNPEDRYARNRIMNLQQQKKAANKNVFTLQNAGRFTRDSVLGTGLGYAASKGFSKLANRDAEVLEIAALSSKQPMIQEGVEDATLTGYHNGPSVTEVQGSSGRPSTFPETAEAVAPQTASPLPLVVPTHSVPIPSDQQVHEIMGALKLNYHIGFKELPTGSIAPWWERLNQTPPEDGVTLSQIQTLLKADEVVIGDMHGSYRKLVETLTSMGVLSMDRQTAQAFAQQSNNLERLVNGKIGLKGDAKAQVEQSYQKLSKLIDRMDVTDSQNKLKLIGDVVGDRGPLDLLTLAVINKVGPERLPILASNHDHAVFRALVGDNPNIGKAEMGSFFRSSDLRPPSEFKDVYQAHLARQSLLQYDTDKKLLYTHAPIQKRHIEELIEQMKQDGALSKDYAYSDAQGNISGFADKANRYYQEYIQWGFRNNQLDENKETVLSKFLWARFFDEKAIKPFPDVIMVHGHDPYDAGRTVNLDNGARKEADDGGYTSRLFIPVAKN